MEHLRCHEHHEEDAGPVQSEDDKARRDVPGPALEGGGARPPEHLAPLGTERFPSFLCDDHVGIPTLGDT